MQFGQLISEEADKLKWADFNFFLIIFDNFTQQFNSENQMAYAFNKSRYRLTIPYYP